jgi:nucleotide-binding universal stress UspA family protein
MVYKSMTVCLDSGADASRRMDFALSLANQHRAHLTGLYMTYVPVVYYDPYGEWGPLMVKWELEARKKHDLVKERSATIAREAGVSFDWFAYRTNELSAAIAHTRASDLTIMGQRNTAVSETDFGNDFYEGFVLKLGRPILYLPHNGPLPKSFDEVLIAWDGGREATRAITDALPLLKLAKQVTVLTIPENQTNKKDVQQADIVAYLLQHEIKAKVKIREGNSATPADQLLACATELKADLLVMGAYGHHRLTELVLGGTTRAIFKHMSLPVLMSH